MDLIGACRAFVSASDCGSVTLGAAAIRIPQSVASRRIMALEVHLGAPLLDRSSRQASLTPFGRSILPSAKRLVESVEAFEGDAARAKAMPLRLAVPEVCTVFDLARLVHAARGQGILLETRAADPAERARRVAGHAGWAALVAVPGADAVWRVPLGLARSGAAAARVAAELGAGEVGGAEPGAAVPGGGEVVSGERGAGEVGSGERPGAVPARVWLQPEDDSLVMRERVAGVVVALGVEAVIERADSAEGAAATVTESHDLMLCSERQADEFDLGWSPLGGVDFERCFDVRAESAVDAARLRDGLRDEIGRALGVPA